jgi:DNA-binding transcriptional LysR family regulator
MEDRLDSLALFAAVVEAGGVSAAARQLRRSKASVSKGLAALETRLGVRLLDRSTRRQRLTEAGALLHERALRLLEDLDAAEAAVGQLQATPRGLLRVAAPLSFGLGRLAPLLPEFLALHSEVSLEAQFEDRYLDLLAERIDVALRIGSLADSSLMSRRICPVARHVVAAPRYLAARPAPTRPADLAAHDCLHYTLSQPVDGWAFEGPGGVKSTPIKARLAANNGDVLATAAIEGAGIALLPGFIVGEALADGRLVELDLGVRPTGIAIHAVWPAGRLTPAKTRAFIDFLVVRLS